MKHLYYNVSFNESKKVGMLDIPEDWQPFPIERSGVPVENIDKLILTLKMGNMPILCLVLGVPISCLHTLRSCLSTMLPIRLLLSFIRYRW